MNFCQRGIEYNYIRRELLILFCIVITTKIYGQDTIYSIAYHHPQPVSNFEDRDTANYFYLDSTQSNNLWQIGTPSKTVFDGAYSAPLALITDTFNTYPNGNISSLEFVVRTDDATSISFWHRFNTDSLADGGVIEVSSDGGATWANIINASSQFTFPYSLHNFYSSTNTISSNGNKPGFTGNSDWIQSTIQGYAFDFIRFRFTFTSDSIDTNKDGWMLDSFDFTCLGTGISEIGSDSPVHIYPNPTSNLISISSDKSIEVKQVSVKDLSGKTIMTTDKTSIDLSNFGSGLYFIEVVTNKASYVGRIQRK